MTQTSTVTQMATTRQIEADAALPHELGCFETYAELAVEAGTADTGDHDEILPDGRTLMAHFHTDLAANPGLCDCQGPHDALIED